MDESGGFPPSLRLYKYSAQSQSCGTVRLYRSCKRQSEVPHGYPADAWVRAAQSVQVSGVVYVTQTFGVICPGTTMKIIIQQSVFTTDAVWLGSDNCWLIAEGD